MIMGHSAGVIAALSLTSAVQSVDVDAMHAILVAEGQILTLE